MALKKKEHWRERAFHAFLLERARAPFKWGVNDCALFAADAILACTGTDIASEFRGKYKDGTGALRVVKQITGGSSVADAAAYCAARHGLEERKHPLTAQRGDLVVLEIGTGLVAGVVHLNGRHVAVVSESGLNRLPITAVKRSWAV